MRAGTACGQGHLCAHALFGLYERISGIVAPFGRHLLIILFIAEEYSAIAKSENDCATER